MGMNDFVQGSETNENASDTAPEVETPEVKEMSLKEKWLFDVDTESRDPLIRLRSKYLVDDRICPRQKKNFLKCQREYDQKHPSRRVPCELHFFEVINCIQQYYDGTLLQKYFWPERKRMKKTAVDR